MNNVSPLVSVVIPMFNAARTIERSLQSLCNQNYHNLEVVIVDDGSYDSSALLIKKFEKELFIKYSYINNSGPSNARNIGIKHSSGKYLVFLDADDRLENNVLSKFVEIAETTKCDIICANFIEENQNLAKLKYVSWGEENTLLYANAIAKKCLDYLKLPTKNVGFGYVWGKVFCSRIIKGKKINFDKSINALEDVKFIFEYLKYCNSAFFSTCHIQTHVIAEDYNSLTFRAFAENRLKGFFEFYKVINHGKKLLRPFYSRKEIQFASSRFYVSFLIVQTIRVATFSPSESKSSVKAFMRKIVKTKRTTAYLRRYERFQKESFLLPFLLKIKLISLALILSQIRGTLRYHVQWK